MDEKEGMEKMSLPLLIRSKLFWYYNGKLDCNWYMGMGDGANVAKQNAYIKDMNRFGINTAVINIMNEELSSIFTGEFMRSTIHEGKLKLLVDFIMRLKNSGKLVVIVFFDCPPAQNAKYPFWRYSSRLAPFLEIATRALAPIVDGFILGIETDRGPCSIDIVEAGIDWIQRFAFRMVGDYRLQLPVGTHEQNVRRNKNGKLYLKRRVPRNADFHGFETMNHPYDGDKVPVSKMVEELQFLVAHSGGIPVWKMESNPSEGAHARKQNRRIAELPGVVGVSGVL